MYGRNIKRSPVTAIIITVLAILFAAALTVAVVFVLKYKSGSDAMQAFAMQAGIQSDEASAELAGLKSELEASKSNLAKLQIEKDELLRSFGTTDERYNQLNAQLAALQTQLTQKQAEIEKLHADIIKLGGVYKVDINEQFKIIEQLEKLLQSGAPMRVVKSVEKDAAGVETEVFTKVYPNISLYYHDLERGFTYSYNDTQVFYTASCLKAPFALSILQAATDELQASAKTPDTVLKYDFDQTYTYIKSDAQSGSGVIINEPEGTVYTYHKLIELMLTKSDNIAYDQLKKKYGTEGFRALANKLGTTAMKKDLSKMTASDGGKAIAAIYEFLQSDSPYSKFMYDAMTTSNHRVMIPAAVPGKTVAHKYGWDIGAYHDMGIVYDKNPYVVVILTDLDGGGTEVDNYIRSVLKLVDKLHMNFYK